MATSSSATQTVSQIQTFADVEVDRDEEKGVMYRKQVKSFGGRPALVGITRYYLQRNINVWIPTPKSIWMPASVYVKLNEHDEEVEAGIKAQKELQATLARYGTYINLIPLTFELFENYLLFFTF